MSIDQCVARTFDFNLSFAHWMGLISPCIICHTMNVGVIVGTRPEIIKMAPIVFELKRRSVQFRLVHTGQHYDRVMSEIFFEELGLPQPDNFLGVGSGTPVEQTARA